VPPRGLPARPRPEGRPAARRGDGRHPGRGVGGAAGRGATGAGRGPDDRPLLTRRQGGLGETGARAPARGERRALISLDANVLLSYYQARSGGTGGLAVGGGPAKYAPTPPWGLNVKAPEPSELLRGALSGRKLIDE